MRNSYANHGASVNNGPDVPVWLRDWQYRLAREQESHQLHFGIAA